MWYFICTFGGGICCGAIIVLVIQLIQTQKMLNKINEAISEREIEETIKEVRTYNSKIKNLGPITCVSESDIDQHVPRLD